MTNTIVWFRRDLRLADNRVVVDAVAAAREAGGGVIPLFVLDDALWKGSGANRRWFLAGCLADLDEQLGGGLVIRHGDPVEVVARLAARHDVTAVYRAQDVGVYGRARDRAVADALAADGRELIEADSPWVVPPGRLHTGSGDTFKVFTPFLRAWRQQRLPRPVERPSDLRLLDGVRSDEVPEAPTVTAELPPHGEAAGHRAVGRFMASVVERYATAREVPAADGTSRLSVYLRFGCLHPRQLMRRLDGRRPDHDTFAKELAWRDFYATVLDAWPGSAWASWNPKMAAMEVDEGAVADQRFDAWREGRTGYPIVDAGMRQLVAEGWMHNRVRMITASFLVKDLHIDWTRGARWFMEQLVDGDLPSNNHGWQWVAGTGTDAAPYYRIFNPTRQSEKFDPDGAYIRRWVPELADLEGKVLHEPWTAPGGPPAGYPTPLVDHAAERDEALHRYNATKN